MQTGDYQTAIAAFGSVIPVDPQYTKAQAFLADCQAKFVDGFVADIEAKVRAQIAAGQLADAQTTVNDALAVCPDSAELLALSQGVTDEFIRYYGAEIEQLMGKEEYARALAAVKEAQNYIQNVDKVKSWISQIYQGAGRHYSSLMKNASSSNDQATLQQLENALQDLPGLEKYIPDWNHYSDKFDFGGYSLPSGFDFSW